MLDAELLGLGLLVVAVARALDETLVVVLAVIDELRVAFDEVVGAGATKTILGIEVCKIKVAVIVA